MGNGPGSLVVSPDAVWVVNSIADTVSRIDPETNLETEAIPVGDGPSGIAFAEGAVWVANGSDGTLSRIDPGSNGGRPCRAGRQHPAGIGDRSGEPVGDRSRNRDQPPRGDAAARLRRSARLVGPRVELLRSDSSIMIIMGDGLVGFKRVGGIDGETLVPDLAVSLPTPTDDGQDLPVPAP